MKFSELFQFLYKFKEKPLEGLESDKFDLFQTIFECNQDQKINH